MKIRDEINKSLNQLPVFYRNIETNEANVNTAKFVRKAYFPEYNSGKSDCFNPPKPISRMINGTEVL